MFVSWCIEGAHLFSLMKIFLLETSLHVVDGLFYSGHIAIVNRSLLTNIIIPLTVSISPR